MVSGLTHYDSNFLNFLIFPVLDAIADANSSGESVNQRENVEYVNIPSSAEDQELHVLPPSSEVVLDRQNASPPADSSTLSNNENGNREYTNV